MKPLSEQLSDLADRAKQAEDTVAAAQAKNRAALQSRRERLKSSIDAATTGPRPTPRLPTTRCSYGGTRLARASITDSRS
jgi:hypothetical protein